MYKEAIINRYRFASRKGNLTLEALFTTDDATLEELADSLKDEVKRSKKGGYFSKKSAVDKVAKAKLAIVLDVIDTIVEKRDAIKNERAIKEEEQELLGLLKNIEDKEKQELPKEEIEKRLAKLRK